MGKDVILTGFKNEFIENHELLNGERTVVNKSPRKVSLLIKESLLLIELILSDTLNSNRGDGKIMYLAKRTIIKGFEKDQEFNFPMFFITESINRLTKKEIGKR